MHLSTLIPGCLLLLFTACADHTGVTWSASDNPPPPVTDPDRRVVDPPVVTQPAEPGGTGNTGRTGGGNGGGGNGGEGGGGGGAPVPEPGTMLLVGTGLAGAALLRRRRKQQTQS